MTTTAHGLLPEGIYKATLHNVEVVTYNIRVPKIKLALTLGSNRRKVWMYLPWSPNEIARQVLCATLGAQLDPKFTECAHSAETFLELLCKYASVNVKISVVCSHEEKEGISYFYLTLACPRDYYILLSSGKAFLRTAP